MLVESVEVIDGEVRAVVTTWDGPLCPVPSGADLDDLLDEPPDDAPTQGALFSPTTATTPAGAIPRGGRLRCRAGPRALRALSSAG